MGPWLALWVLLYLPRPLQGQNPHTPAAPSSVLQSFEDSKVRVGEGREAPTRPGRGESARPALSAPPPWRPLASPAVPTSPSGVGGNVSVPLHKEAPLASVTGPAGPGALSASCQRDQTREAVAECRGQPSWPLPTPSPLQFQGEWFVLGLAGNTHTVADRSLLSPFTATFTLNENHLEVAYAMIR